MTWLETYMQWTKDLESPTPYHMWSALAAASHVLGRNVWMIRMGGKWVIFPGQIMVVLVGPTAVKKDTAMQQAMNLLRAMPKGTVNVLPEKVSPQEFLPQLAANGPKRPAVGFIYASEMGSFFSTESWMDQMVTLVTNLWNAPTGFVDPATHAIEPTIKRFEFRSWSAELRDPCVGGLMAITPEGVATELPASARKRGFMGRLLWAYAGSTDRPPNPGTSWTEDEGAERDALLAGLEALACLRGPVWFSRQGREWFDHWYVNVHAPATATAAEEAHETGYMGRKADHLLRVAITLAAIAHVSGGQPFEVRTANLTAALRLLDQMERALPNIMGEVGRAPAAEKMAAFLRYLDSGKKRRIRCLQYIWKKGVVREEFDRMVAYAVEMQAIRVLDEGRAVYYERVMTPGQALRSTKES